MKASLRIQMVLAFICCMLVSVLIDLASAPLFAHKERRLDFTEGIVTIDESGRDLVKRFNQMNQDINGLVKQLGDEDTAFKNQFLNRPLPSSTGNEEWIAVPGDGDSVYHLTRNEIIQFLLNTPKQQNNLNAIMSDSEGNVLYKSDGVTDTQVDIPNAMAEANKPFLNQDQGKHPKVTRLYSMTINGATAYCIVQGSPQPTVIYVNESEIPPIFLGIVTFFICFYFITKRKMKEFKEIALGLMEIAKGNLKFRIREKSKDELGSLAANINFMASELNQMIERERQAEKLKDELITNVSHDLRTPLTSIMGYMRLVKDHQYKSKAQLDEYVDIAYGKSEQLKKLIEDLFDFTRLNYEGVQLKKENVSLNQMLRQLTEELDPIAKDSHVTFINDLPKEPIIMEVDPNQMVRAFENVLTNAIKYSTPPGTIHIQIVNQQHSVQISVSNPCEALSEEEVNRLFDRFYRVDTSRSSSKSGAGLGLAITKSIIDLHHGTIHVDYENEVIRLTITLPFNENMEA